MWFKVDDTTPNNRKTRAVRRSHPTKKRDVAPFGLWTLAGAWTNDGWVPLELLEDWDDDAEDLAERLVAAGYWHHEDRDGEPGYLFNDWHEYNPSTGAKDAGGFGNHKRWHVDRGIVQPGCVHCPVEPDLPPDPEFIAPISGGDRGAISGANPNRSHTPTRPDPTRPDPEPLLLVDESTDPDLFDEFWDTYGKKVKRADAERKWAKAIKKAPPELIIARAAAYVANERARNQGGRFIADPSTWLHGERWNDELATYSAATPARQQQTDDLFARAAERMGVADGPR